MNVSFLHSDKRVLRSGVLTGLQHFDPIEIIPQNEGVFDEPVVLFSNFGFSHSLQTQAGQLTVNDRTAIGMNDLPGNIRGILRSQKDKALGDFFRLTGSAHRHILAKSLNMLGRER